MNDASTATSTMTLPAPAPVADPPPSAAPAAAPPPKPPTEAERRAKFLADEAREGRRTLEDWSKHKPHWLFASACILAGWTAAQRQSVEPLTYAEADYDAGLKLAGDNPLGSKRAKK